MANKIPAGAPPLIAPKPGWNRYLDKKTNTWFYMNPKTKETIRPINPATENTAPSVEDWLTGDTTYQDQQAQLRRAYADFQATQNLNKNNYELSYAQQLRDLGQQKEQGFTNLEDDYASRGLLKSGVYAKAFSNLQDQFNNRQSDLDTAKAQYLAGLNQSLSSFQNDQNTTLTSAKQQAIARRAAKYNLAV